MFLISLLFYFFQDVLLDRLKKEICSLKQTLGLEEEPPTGIEHCDVRTEPESAPQKCPIQSISLKPRVTTPVTVLCVHPSSPGQLLVHWKPTAKLAMSGYEVRFK